MAGLLIHLPRRVARGAVRRLGRTETDLPEPSVPPWPGAVRAGVIVGGAGLCWGLAIWLFRLASS